MKRKYQGFASLIIFVISLIAMACYAVYFTYTLPGTAHISGAVSIPDINIPDKDVIAYIDYIKQHLTDLVLLTKNTEFNNRDGNVDLKLFGYKPTRGGKNEKNISVKTENGFSHILSLAFFSENHCFCVIDGKLYPEKAFLPHGGKIEKIENNRVLISKNNRKAWIYISSNLHKLSVKNNTVKTDEKIKIERKQNKTREDEKAAEIIKAETSKAGNGKPENNKIKNEKK